MMLTVSLGVRSDDVRKGDRGDVSAAFVYDYHHKVRIVVTTPLL